jgi:hypothetical protein
MKEKVVFAVVVTTRHLFADFFQNIKNALGMNLKSYENLISEAIEQALFKLYKCYPDVYDVQIATPVVTVNGSAQIIVYGKIKCQT